MDAIQRRKKSLPANLGRFIGMKEVSRALQEGQEDWPELIALVPKQEEAGDHHYSYRFVP